MCQICGIIAWVMGHSDLRDMRAGRMDPSGEGLTNAGKICGIVSVVLLIIGIGLAIVAMMGGLLAAGTAVSPGG